MRELSCVDTVRGHKGGVGIVEQNDELSPDEDGKSGQMEYEHEICKLSSSGNYMERKVFGRIYMMEIP